MSQQGEESAPDTAATDSEHTDTQEPNPAAEAASDRKPAASNSNSNSPAHATQSMVYCSYCSVQLTYPTGSMYIQCPKCRNIMNPQTPQETHCIGCGTLLAHPPTSLHIQCPKCLTVMNAREGGSRPRDDTEPKPQQSGSASSSSTTKKKKRDPNAPKAASNAYMIFCKDMRPKLKQKHPELTFGMVGAKLGELWRNLSPDEKKPYEDKAASDRERYRREMEAYQQQIGTANDSTNSHGRDVERSVKRLKTDSKSGAVPMLSPTSTPSESAAGAL